MPKLRGSRTAEIRTWLTADDMFKLKQLAKARGMKDTDFAREALLTYLLNYEAEQRDKLETVYAQQLKVSTDEIVSVIKAGVNRICALLAKNAVQSLASNKFLSRLEDTEDMMKECQGAAAKQIHEQLTKEESAVAQQMSGKITKR
jgi:hypothetical protein